MQISPQSSPCKQAFIFIGLTLIVAGFSTPCLAADADVAVSLGRFGVGIYSLAASSFPNTPSSDFSPATIQSDVSALTEKYKTDLTRARATVEVTESLGDVIIKGTLVGTASGVGAVPAALIGSAATWGNKQFASMVQKNGEEAAQRFLYQSVQHWDDAKGVKYEDVVVMLESGNRKGAEDAFDNATGFLSQLRDQIKDATGEKIAENFLFSTMQRTKKGLIEVTGQNTANIATLSSDLDKNIKFTRTFSEKTGARLDKYSSRLASLNSSLQSASADIADPSKSAERDPSTGHCRPRNPLSATIRSRQNLFIGSRGQARAKPRSTQQTKVVFRRGATKARADRGYGPVCHNY